MAIHPQNALHTQSIQDRESFWMRAAANIHWNERPTKAFGVTSRNTIYADEKKQTWFPNATMNTCYNCLDRHVYTPQHAGSPPLSASPQTPHLAINQDHANKIAFHHVSPLPFQQEPYRKVTYGQALEMVQTLSGVLKYRGVKKGDVVTIYMPMMIESAIAMLACTRIGAIHSVVFGGFAAKELGKRIQDGKAKMVIAASCGLEPKGPLKYKPLVDEAIKSSSHKPSSGLLFLRRHTIRGHQPEEVSTSGAVPEYDWDVEMDLTRRGIDGRDKCWSCEPMASEDPLYVLYTSGSTGMPKGVVRLNAGHAVALRYSIEHTFGMTSNDTMLCASDLGWVVGHSYILYAVS